MSEERNVYEQRWATFSEAVIKLAQENGVVSTLLAGAFVDADENGVVKNMPIMSTGNMPTLSSVRALYDVRDKMLNGLRVVADQGIEAVLKLNEERAAQAAQTQQADAAPVDAT